MTFGCLWIWTCCCLCVGRAQIFVVIPIRFWTLNHIILITLIISRFVLLKGFPLGSTVDAVYLMHYTLQISGNTDVSISTNITIEALLFSGHFHIIFYPIVLCNWFWLIIDIIPFMQTEIKVSYIAKYVVYFYYTSRSFISSSVFSRFSCMRLVDKKNVFFCFVCFLWGRGVGYC